MEVNVKKKKKKVSQILVTNPCSNCKIRQALLIKHICPFSKEIHNDPILCNCCNKCENACLLEI